MLGTVHFLKDHIDIYRPKIWSFGVEAESRVCQNDAAKAKVFESRFAKGLPWLSLVSSATLCLLCLKAPHGHHVDGHGSADVSHGHGESKDIHGVGHF